jgi:hypothetical protein
VRRALPLLLLAIAAPVAGAIGCSALLDLDRLRNGHDQGVLVEDLAGADLTGVDQAGQDLAGVDLAGADLAGLAGCQVVAGGPYFDPLDEHDAPAYPRSLAVADVDEDGKLDLIVGTDSNSVYVLKNQGGRVFAAGIGMASGCTNGYHRMLLVGDFDGDGHLDLLDGCDNVYGGSVTNELAFLKGTGAGGFAAPVQLGDRAKNPLSGAVADLDGDKIPDAVVAGLADNGITVYWGSKTAFTTQPPLHVPTGFQPWGLSIGSLGGDAVPDVVVANAGGDVGDMAIANGSISVLRRSRVPGSERSFATTDLINLGTNEPAQVGLARLDADSHPELVVPLFAMTSIAIVPGIAMSTGSSFGLPGTGPAAFSAPRALAIGDLDCDGIDDAVLTHFQLNADPTDYDRFEIYRGGAGSLTKVLTHDVGVSGAPASDRVRIADLDGDGHPDVVMTLLTATGSGKYRILWGRATP